MSIWIFHRRWSYLHSYDDDIPNKYRENFTPGVTAHFDQLKHLSLPPQDPMHLISLLIGRDQLEAHMILEKLTGSDIEPFAQCLALGLVLINKFFVHVTILAMLWSRKHRFLLMESERTLKFYAGFTYQSPKRQQPGDFDLVSSIHPQAAARLVYVHTGKMPGKEHCSVPGCNGNKLKYPDLSFHHIPKTKWAEQSGIGRFVMMWESN